MARDGLIGVGDDGAAAVWHLDQTIIIYPVHSDQVSAGVEREREGRPVAI